MQQQTIPDRQPTGSQTNELVEQFRCMRPHRLKGSEGPMGTKKWIRELEQIFRHLECTEMQEVSCAVFQLAEEASYCWESHTRTTTPEELRALTWEMFKKIVIDHYFPQSYRDQKETGFLHLK